jgi:hypothetical protein
VVLIDLVTCFMGLAVAKVARFPKVRILFAKFPPQKYSFLRWVRQKCFGKSLRNKRKRMFWEKKEGGVVIGGMAFRPSGSAPFMAQKTDKWGVNAPFPDGLKGHTTTTELRAADWVRCTLLTCSNVFATDVWPRCG